MFSIKNHDSLVRIVFTIFVFLATLIFFINIHPVTIISGDDWGNFSSSRSAYPEWHGFNPIKVIPETIMPYSGFIASFVIKPILGVNFLFSIAIVTAIIVSLLLSVFFNELFKFINIHLRVKKEVTVFVLAIIFLYMFSFLKSKPDNESTYLLWEINITCYYHYIIPAIINTTFSLYLLRTDLSLSELKRKKPLYVGWIFFVVYSCIFSNIFHSIIIASACISKILILTIQRKNTKNFLNYGAVYFVILSVWMLSVFFEANGERASSFSENTLLLQDSIVRFVSIVASNSNRIYRNLLIACWAIGAGVFLISKSRKDKNLLLKESILFLSLGMIVFIFVMLVCAKSSPGYTERPAAMWGIYINIFIATGLLLAWIVERNKISIYFLPIIIFILVSKAAAPNTSLREPYNLNLTYEQAYKITDNIINQVMDADQKNQKELELRVPKEADEDNWPFPIYMGQSVYDTLKSNGIISNKIKIKIKPDEGMNEELHIN